MCSEPWRGQFLALLDRLSEYNFELTLQDTSQLEVVSLPTTPALSKEEIESKLLQAEDAHQKAKEFDKIDDAENEMWSQRLSLTADSSLVVERKAIRKRKKQRKPTGQTPKRSESFLLLKVTVDLTLSRF